jgi:thymidylate kinase
MVGGRKMIINFEGLSRTGKTTMMNMFRKKYPNWIYWSGLRRTEVVEWGKGIAEEHKVIERLCELNPTIPIIADRFCSEYVYNESTTLDLVHLFRNHRHMFTIYLELDEAQLHDRKTFDAFNINTFRTRYNDLLKRIPHERINTSHKSKEEVFTEIEKIVLEKIGEANPPKSFL